jgi:N-acetylneuraminic acid mutarotase
MTDSRGHRSNQLEDTFRIAEFPWVAKQPMLLPRRDFATATLDGRIYVIGGGDVMAGVIPAPPTTTVEVYDPTTDSWTLAAPMPRAVTNHAAVALNGKIYVIGGQEEFLPMSDAVQEYDPVTQLWTLRTGMPTAREAIAAAVLDGRIFVIGGSSGGMDVATVEAYDPAADSWTSLASLSEPRRDLAAEVLNGELFALGGYTGTFVLDAGYRRVVEVYDPVANAWSTAEDMPIPRADFASSVVATQLIVAGGGNVARALTDVSSLDATTGTWRMRTPMPTALAWPRGEAVAGKLYVIDTDATYEYTPGNDIL